MNLRSPENFKMMYREELRYVLGTLERLGAPALQLEDLCHDVFMAAFRKRADYDASRPLRPWLFGIAFRMMLNVRRKHEEVVLGRNLEHAVDQQAGPEQAMDDKEARGALERAIQTLEPHRRAVFILHDLEGQPAPEIARVLDIPLNTAYSRLRLARADVLQATQYLRTGGHS